MDFGRRGLSVFGFDNEILADYPIEAPGNLPTATTINFNVRQWFFSFVVVQIVRMYVNDGSAAAVAADDDDDGNDFVYIH